MRVHGSVDVDPETFADVVDDVLVHLGVCLRPKARHMPAFNRTEMFIVWPGSPSEWRVPKTEMNPRLVARVLDIGERFGFDSQPRWLQPFGIGGKDNDLSSTLSVSAAKRLAEIGDENDGPRDDDLRAMSPYLIRQTRLLNQRERAWRMYGGGHRFVAEQVFSCPRNDGRYMSTADYAWWNGSAWTSCDPSRESRNDDGSIGESVGFAFAFARERLGWWTARFHLEGSSVDLPTDPSGARAAFKDRAAVGKGRRPALRHWVRAHARTVRRSDAEDLAWVRAHLRGRTRFAWHGLDIELIPSARDLTASEMGVDPAELRSIVAAGEPS